MMNQLTIVTVNHNTPFLIYTLLRSLHKYNAWYKNPLYVIDNSTIHTLPQVQTQDIVIEYFDNTLYAGLERYARTSKEPTLASAHHAFTVDWFIRNRVNTDYLLLVDSDILFTRSCLPYFQEFIHHNYALMGYERTTYAKHTIAPWCCFINIKKMKSHMFNYFDINRILYVNNNMQYDTGASLYEDFKIVNEPIKTIPDNLFTIHLKCGSNNPQKHDKFISEHMQYL